MTVRLNFHQPSDRIRGVRVDTGRFSFGASRKRYAQTHWRTYAASLFGAPVTADRHVRAWAWFAALTPGVAPRPLVECWARGGGKSSTIEGAVSWIGSQPVLRRRFVLYVCRTQLQANAHVQAIGTLLERAGVGREVNAYNQSKGWKQNLLRADTGFNVLAFGLDAAMRGTKIDLFRPDLIVLDDLDDKHDTAEAAEKKIETMTETVLPSGSADAAIVFVQNKIHDDSIMARLADGRADFLHDRLPVVIEPAVIDLQVTQVPQDDGTLRYVVTGGTPTWDGQNLAVVESQINKWGLLAFNREAQHETDALEGGLWDKHLDIDRHRDPAVPVLTRIVVAVDPNAGGADEAGIIVAGVADRGSVYQPNVHAYILDDRTVGGGSKVWAEAAVTAYHVYKADALVAEKNNGGDMVAITLGTIRGAPPVDLVHASRGKLTRAEPVQKLYRDGRVHHAGVFPALEKELCTWRPGKPSPNRLDALVWAVTTLLITEAGEWSAGDLQALGRTREGRR
jgi:hypothetical protein